MTAAASLFVDTSPRDDAPSGVHPRPVSRPRTLAAQIVHPRKAVRILDLVGEQFGVTWSELLSKRRPRHLANARHVAAWLMYQAGMSYPEVGRALGGRDHTTAMNSVANVERERQDPSVRSALDVLLGQLTATGATRGPSASSASKEGIDQP